MEIPSKALIEQKNNHASPIIACRLLGWMINILGPARWWEKIFQRSIRLFDEISSRRENPNEKNGKNETICVSAPLSLRH